jgi:hypothetical protein
VKLGRLVVNGILGIEAAQLLGGVLDGVGRCLKGSYQWYVMRHF